ncbi:MAG: PEP-CTERM sorting domain-containing protein [Candidatus Accumulibacter meliphilus]|jgi:hypothetical protein|uniref:PEP-CTERM sorting domain-containing protein n=1 Tax=Candidatus Accumulibacter meliphilus TaxID=2211374 RepID=UPI002FC2E587
MKTKLFKSVAVAALAIAALPAAAADNSLTWQGVTFNTTVIDSNTLQLDILNAATGATPDWSGINYIKAFEIKEIGDVTSATISGPGSFAANVSQGLSANVGCQTGGTNGACFTGAPIALTDNMGWTLGFTSSGALDFSLPHLKVQFLKDALQDKATGDLLSQNIPPVPEPEAYAMMLAGLGMLGVIARRRRSSEAPGTPA